MRSKKFLSISFVSVMLAGVVAFFACNKNNDLTPAADGSNLAGELCDCFTKAGNDDAKKLICLSDFETKRDKWKDAADAEAFDVAFKQAIASCANDPYQWKLSYTATIAAAEFCALAAQHPDGGDMMILAPLYSKYEAELNSENPAFLEPFFAGLIACSPASNWILCTFRMTDFCPPAELTDKELADLAATATPEFCKYFTENPEADMNSMLMSAVAQYGNYFSKPAFIEALLYGLGSCESTPQWFICMMTGNTAPGCN
jgi:hypothetical protein